MNHHNHVEKVCTCSIVRQLLGFFRCNGWCTGFFKRTSPRSCREHPGFLLPFQCAEDSLVYFKKCTDKSLSIVSRVVTFKPKGVECLKLLKSFILSGKKYFHSLLEMAFTIGEENEHYLFLLVCLDSCLVVSVNRLSVCNTSTLININNMFGSQELKPYKPSQ